MHVFGGHSRLVPGLRPQDAARYVWLLSIGAVFYTSVGAGGGSVCVERWGPVVRFFPLVRVRCMTLSVDFVLFRSRGITMTGYDGRPLR